MKNKTYLLSTLQAAVLGISLLVAIFVRSFAPGVIIPSLNIPNMVLLSLAALLPDHYLAPGAKRCYICIPLFSAAAYALLPWAAGFTAGLEILKLALVGGAVFTLVTVLFSSIQERLSSGPVAKAAPLLSALGLYLAFQALTGMIL